MTSNITKIQANIRRYITQKNNIFMRFKKTRVKNSFKKEIWGYHLINQTPIKESVWEEINRNIVRDVCVISDCANGNHLSGKDNKFDNWNISNKTAKVENNGKINISSYRLTSVCNNRSVGNKNDILDEISKRDKSYEYYSILLRKEMSDKIIYSWCIIPKKYYVFNLMSQKFTEKIGQRGKNKDKVVGWKGETFDITFSMSSQLWFHFNYESIKKYIIDEVTVDLNKSKLTYSDIFDLYVKKNSFKVKIKK